MDELGDRARAERPDMAHLVAHGVERGAVRLEHRLVAADQHGELARLRAARAPAHRRVEQLRADLREGRMQAADEHRRVGGEVEPDLALGETRQQFRRNGLHLGRAGQRGQHHVRGFGDRARAFRPCGPGRLQCARRLAVQVVDGHLEARPADIERHGPAHGAEADKSDMHGFPLPSGGRRRPPCLNAAADGRRSQSWSLRCRIEPAMPVS